MVKCEIAKKFQLILFKYKKNIDNCSQLNMINSPFHRYILSFATDLTISEIVKIVFVNYTII